MDIHAKIKEMLARRYEAGRLGLAAFLLRRQKCVSVPSSLNFLVVKCYIVITC